MIPLFTHLQTDRLSADQTAYTTPSSIAPVADALVLAGFSSAVSAGNPNVPTVSGGGVASWSVHLSFLRTSPNGLRRITLLRALTGSAPSSGQVTFDLAGQTQLMGDWSLVQVTQCLLTGTNGANAIRQTKTGEVGGTSQTLTFDAAWGHADNRAFGAFALSANRGIAAGAGMTLLGSIGGGSDGSALGTLAGRDGSSLSVTATQDGASANWLSIIAEIVGASDGASRTYPRMTRRRLPGGLL